ncbi:efflux RND transporter periplasmic adaptor subunit [Paenibacillus sp. M1]|uniref:Efflux RND transporter periplasmic adaptor subunit n=1 Tax=Paenibacillus haidiansis TaxID=1574488 RepID=A0ABU7VTN0_9BACL
MKQKKWLWIGIGAVVLIAIIVILILSLRPDKQNEAAAPTVNTTKVTKGNIVVSVAGSGSVTSTVSETVRTKDEGKVKEVLVEEGDIVKKGQVLLTFEAADLADSLESQERSLKSQKLDLEDLQEQYKRQVQEGADDEALNATKKSITKQELNIADVEKEIASIKEDMIAPDPLTSPIDGTITTVNITEGEQAKNGDELFVINNYQDLSVKIQVDELDIPEVALGMKSTVEIDALPGQTFEGEVSDIADEGVASNGVSLFDVTIKLLKSDGVRVGMSAEATVILNEKNDILTLPIEAVQQRGDKYIVMLPNGGSADGDSGDKEAAAPPAADEVQPQGDKAQAEGAPSDKGGQGAEGASRGNMKEVEVGVHDESTIEIVSGLNEGDEVVIPTVLGNSSGAASAQQQMQGQMGGGFGGGGGGFEGGGPGGGTPGGGGFGGGGGGR